MNLLRPSLLAAIAIVALVGAQDVMPGLDFYHTWQYAALVGIAAIVVTGAAWSRRATFVGLAALGVIVIAVAGLASGLLGPDTATVARAPGTVAPLPSLGVAAFFGQADASAIARGDATILLRRPGHAEIALAPGNRRLYGPAVITAHPETVAYIQARNTAGERLTVTQPTNATFLSPLLLFGQTQRLGKAVLPFDTFALPAKNVIVHAMYVAPGSALATTVGNRFHGEAAILFTIDDQADRPLGIAITPDGREVDAGGIRLRATIGTYPALVISSAPYPLALAAGGAVALAGLAGMGWRRRSLPALEPRTPSYS